MLTRIRKTMDEREEGFTLIELLVVIIIIGILAAIAIPVFLRQREKGYRADMKSALKNGATAVESYATETGGNYSAVTLGLMQAEGFKFSSTLSPVVVGANTDANEYCLSVTDTRLPGETWYYDSDEGVPSRNACTSN